MNNIDLMDASLISSAVDSSKGLKNEKVVFGGKYNWKRYNRKLISKEEYKFNKLKPLIVRGSCLDPKGNRKFELDIENNQVIFKPSRSVKIFAKLPKTKHHATLVKLQQLCELKEAYFTCGIDNTYIYITFDEMILRKEAYFSIKKRILAIDLNPNYVAYVITDNDKILFKEIIGLKELNEQKTNKKKHEDYEITKRIVETAKHYQVAHIVYEKLNIKPKDLGKGKAYNKLCNNNWRRSRIVGSLIKRCNIIGIHTQEVVAQYSSFIGQIDNEQEYDSIAAAIELARRGNLYLRRYYYNENIDVKNKIIRINEILPDNLMDRWKKKLDFSGKISSYKSLYDIIKKSAYSYRNLFQFKWFSFRMKSCKSSVYFSSVNVCRYFK